MSDFYCFFMTKIAKKKKDNKLNLSVKVHSSPLKIRKKSTSRHIIESPARHEKSLKAKRRIKIFKKEDSHKTKGFLEKEEAGKRQFSKKKVNKKKELVIEDRQDFFMRDNPREERAKILLMKSGVTFFMLLIFVMWAYNIKRSIVNSSPKNNSNNILEVDSWQDVSDEISEKMKEIKDGKEKIEDLKIDNEKELMVKVQEEIESDFVFTEDSKSASSSTLISKPADIASSSEEIERIKEGISKILK